MLTIVPDAGSNFEKELVSFIKKGGQVIIYGPADHASEELLSLLNLENKSPLKGEFKIIGDYVIDELKKTYPDKIRHTSLFSGGGISATVKNKSDHYTRILVKLTQAKDSRDIVWVRANPEWSGGKVAYVRGTNSSHFEGGRLLKPDDPSMYFTGPTYLRYILKEFGLEYAIDKNDPSIKSPVLSISRSNNGYFFSGYVPNTTVKQRFKFSQGAPIMLGYDSELKNGYTTYQFPTSWNRECRVFVKQNRGIVSCKELHSGELGISRRLQISGLDNATVRIFPDKGITEDKIHFYLNAEYPWKEGQQTFKRGERAYGNNYIIKGVTGILVVSW
ncbi:MAG: hypothetical protein Q8N05_03745, partial [Bacteroidota bacterium]|nr:hypothetical protein [Bacteroidota bacterium]